MNSCLNIMDLSEQITPPVAITVPACFEDIRNFLISKHAHGKILPGNNQTKD